VLVHDMSFVAAPQRGDQALRVLCLHRPCGTRLAHHGGHRPTLLAWLGGRACAPFSRRGPAAPAPTTDSAPAPEFRPIARDLQRLIRELESDYRSRDESQITWSPDALRAILHGELRGEDSHRRLQPRTLHPRARQDERIERAPPGQRPGHRAGTGHARLLRHLDRPRQRQRRPRHGRRHDRVAVPPEDPAYQLRRVWLPRRKKPATTTASPTRVCGRSATSPTCAPPSAQRLGALRHAVNQVRRRRGRRGEAEPRPHRAGAGLPLRPAAAHAPRALPDATIITFWHIPWPNPEAFSICPWREEILDGLLGSSILGFHTQFHCNNFVDTVDRFLEARVDRELHGLPTAASLTW
jgi:trehalose 6-phosphate synthase